jgi:hypothetical protein
MEPMHLAATDKTPAVRFDPAKGELEITGCSIHENADDFFTPLWDKVDAYVARPASRTHVSVRLSYFNSSSAKYLLDILKRLDDLHASGTSKVSLEWIHEEGDLDMQEAGNDYKGLLDMPVKVVAR